MAASLRRIVAVTAGISGLGMVCGSLLGSLAFWVQLGLMPGTSAPHEQFKLAMLGIAGGALFGAVLAPIVAWLFLRRATLARAIGETAAGVLLGIAVGAIVWPRHTILLALVGFVAAGARLWWFTRARVGNDPLRAGAGRSSAWR
jgi:hypothetical protein